MAREMEALRKVFGKDANITEWEEGRRYNIDSIWADVDELGQTMYTDVFYKYFDYADVDGYRISWEKEEYRA